MGPSSRSRSRRAVASTSRCTTAPRWRSVRTARRSPRSAIPRSPCIRGRRSSRCRRRRWSNAVSNSPATCWRSSAPATTARRCTRRRCWRCSARSDSTSRRCATRPSFPLEEAARIDAERRGEGPTALHQNCSGKHAGMLATCCINGWPIDDYLDLEHPLQVAITASIEKHGAPVDHVGVDGCGAPTHAIGLADLARSFASIARSQSAVAQSMSARPDLVGGRATRCHSMDGRAARARDEGRRGRRDGGGVPRRPGVRGEDRQRRRRCTAGRDRASAARALGVDLDDLDGPVPAGPRVLGHGREVGRIEALPWTS